MDGVDPGEVSSQADHERARRQQNAKAVLEWLLDSDRQGTMYRRSKLVAEIANTTDLSPEDAAAGVRGTVGDIVDPVQQISVSGEKYVGIMEYRKEPDLGLYSYIQYHDRLGQRKRSVCAKCVEEAEAEENVTHATAGEGTVPATASWSDLHSRIQSHYSDAHETQPSSVSPGASLLSGTTIGSNKAFHAGNDGPASGLDADTLQGNSPSAFQGGPPIYGGGSDGAVTVASNTGVPRLQTATTYTIEEGATAFIGATLFVMASESITVNGKIDAGGSGAPGGDGGDGTENSSGFNGGQDGFDGRFVPLGTGGEVTGNAGSGGDGDTSDPPNRELFEAFTQPEVRRWFQNAPFDAGAGGGGGSSGYAFEDQPSGTYSTFPGGGAPGSEGFANGYGGGGGGGAGGGFVFLAAPEIEINGVIDASGNDGNDGGSRNDIHGGGGGGGSGGVVVLQAGSVTGAANVDVSGGVGGEGGDGAPERKGADGADGLVLQL